MIDPMILKALTFSRNFINNSQGSGLDPIKKTSDFLSFLRESLNPGQKKLFQQPAGFNKINELGQSPQRGKGLKENHRSYIEAFKKAFLSRGKPLEQIVLNQNDLNELNNFLSYCGFSRENRVDFFKGLVENNQGQQINLSEFFNRLEKFEPLEQNSDLSILPEPAALDIPKILHLESILKEFGFSPKEVDHIFNHAKFENGKLDLAKLVMKLKKVRGGMEQAKPAEYQGKKSSDHLLISDVKAVDLVSRKLEKMNIHLPANIMGKTGGPISIKDVITALEQKIGKTENTGQLPDEVKAAIANTAGKIGGTIIEQGNASSMLSLIHPKFTATNSKDKITEKNNILSFLQKNSVGNVQDHSGFKKEDILPFSQKNNIANAKDQNDLKKEDTLPFSQKNNIANAKDQNDLKKEDTLPFSQKNNIANTKDQNDLKKENMPLFSQDNNAKQDANPVLQGSVKSISHMQDGKLSLVSEPVSNTVKSTVSDTIHTVKPQTIPENNPLPKYVINQVGKQVSMSVIRGETMIKMQLKPPELGSVKVEMDIKENVLKLGVITENSSVKELLLSNANDLRRVLVEQGVKLDKLEVNINSEFGQSMANSKDSKGRDQGWNKGVKSIFSNGEEQSPIIPPVFSKDNSLLDLMA